MVQFRPILRMIAIHEQLKTLRYAVGHGYALRRRNFREYGILIHTTNGKPGSSFQSEVNYLYNSPDKSIHFIVSKEGKIVQLLPVTFQAWHAGAVNDPHFDNHDSIGIELHYAPGEPKKQPILNSAVKDLIHHLITLYPIFGIETHRAKAVDSAGKTGRKSDPSHMSDSEFFYWRDAVFNCVFEKKIKKGSILYTAPAESGAKAEHITETIGQGFIEKGILQDDVITSIQYVKNGWVWIPSGIGFLKTSAILP